MGGLNDYGAQSICTRQKPCAFLRKRSAPDTTPYLPDADPDFDVVYAIRPHSAMMWRLAEYDASQRRWSR